MLFALHFKVVSSILTIFSRSEGNKFCYYSLQFHSEWFETNIFSSQTLYIFTHAAPMGRDDPNQTLYIFTHAAPVGRDDPNQTLYIFTHAAPVGRDDPNQTLYIFTHAAPVGRDDPNQNSFPTFMPLRISFISFRRASFSFICCIWSWRDFIARNPLRGINKTMMAIPASTDTPSCPHSNHSARQICRGADHIIQR